MEDNRETTTAKLNLSQLLENNFIIYVLDNRLSLNHKTHTASTVPQLIILISTVPQPIILI